MLQTNQLLSTLCRGFNVTSSAKLLPVTVADSADSAHSTDNSCSTGDSANHTIDREQATGGDHSTDNTRETGNGCSTHDTKATDNSCSTADNKATEDSDSTSDDANRSTEGRQAPDYNVKRFPDGQYVWNFYGDEFNETNPLEYRTVRWLHELTWSDFHNNRMAKNIYIDVENMKLKRLLAPRIIYKDGGRQVVQLQRKYPYQQTACMAYMFLGEASTTRCGRCDSNKRCLAPFPECVVVSNVGNGACLNCYYMNQTAQCDHKIAAVDSERGWDGLLLAEHLELADTADIKTWLGQITDELERRGRKAPNDQHVSKKRGRGKGHGKRLRGG